MALTTSGNLSKVPLSRIICVLAVNAPPGRGENGIIGLTDVASGGRKYLAMQSLNTFSASWILCGSISKVYSLPRSACHMVKMSGWQVPPETGCMERSKLSAPFSIAAKQQAIELPAVSCVWNTILVPLGSSLRAIAMVLPTVVGVEVPDASLKHTESNGTPESKIWRKIFS